MQIKSEKLEAVETEPKTRRWKSFSQEIQTWKRSWFLFKGLNILH